MKEGDSLEQGVQRGDGEEGWKEIRRGGKRGRKKGGRLEKQREGAIG